MWKQRERAPVVWGSVPGAFGGESGVNGEEERQASLCVLCGGGVDGHRVSTARDDRDTDSGETVELLLGSCSPLLILCHPLANANWTKTPWMTGRIERL